MKKKVKPYIKYILLFFYFLFCLIISYSILRNDTFVNYGFSYAIRNGEIPYKDFNLVIPPFSPFLYSLFLIFNKSILSYYIAQAFLLTLFSAFIFKILGENKGFLFLLIMCLPFPISFASTIFPGYNFLAFFLLIILIYLEKEKKDDRLIGIILGLCFCTKQTIGIAFLLSNIYYLITNKKKFFKRISFFFIPIFLLFLYLICTKSLYSFIDLCFLGLLDFGSTNSYKDPFYLVILIIFLIICLLKIKNNKTNIINYYILGFLFMTLPIIDFYHTSYFALGVILLILLDFNLVREIKIHAFLFMIFISGLYLGVEFKYIDNMKICNFPNFPYLIYSNSYYIRLKKVNNYTQKLNKDVIFLVCGTENYLFKIMNNERLTYFDLPNYGNYGYNGVEKILNKVKHQQGYFVLDSTLYGPNPPTQQYIVELSTYIRNNSQKIKTIDNFEIYLKE